MNVTVIRYGTRLLHGILNKSGYFHFGKNREDPEVREHG